MQAKGSNWSFCHNKSLYVSTFFLLLISFRSLLCHDDNNHVVPLNFSCITILHCTMYIAMYRLLFLFLLTCTPNNFIISYKCFTFLNYFSFFTIQGFRYFHIKSCCRCPKYCDLSLKMNIQRLCFVFCLYISNIPKSKRVNKENIKVSCSNYDNLRIKYCVLPSPTPPLPTIAVSAQITLRSDVDQLLFIYI